YAVDLNDKPILLLQRPNFSADKFGSDGSVEYPAWADFFQSIEPAVFQKLPHREISFAFYLFADRNNASFLKAERILFDSEDQLILLLWIKTIAEFLLFQK